MGAVRVETPAIVVDMRKKWQALAIQRQIGYLSNVYKLRDTANLIFREFQTSDWNAVHAYAADSEVVQFMDWGPNTEEQTKAFIQIAIDEQSKTPRFNYEQAVVLKSTRELIGTAGIRIQDLSNQAGDFGYILHPNFWGNGYGTEIAKELVAFGFQQLNLHRLSATCRPDNLASARVLEKAGLRYEGLLRGHKKIRHQWVDSYLYAILNEEENNSTAILDQSLKMITIRDARLEDAKELVEAEQAISQNPGFLVSRPHELTIENFQGKIQHLAHIPNGKYIVAEKDNKIVGHALLDPLHLSAIQHVVHLTIAVHPGSTGQGIGKSLLSHLISWANTAPTVEKIELHVRATNWRAISLYRKLGFLEEGRWRKRVKIDETRYVDDVLMGLWVSQKHDL